MMIKASLDYEKYCPVAFTKSYQGYGWPCLAIDE